MNKFLLSATIVALIVIGTGFYFVFTHRKHSTEKMYRIALFEPASHPAMDQISQGFIDTMQHEGKEKYSFVRYNANGNKTLQRAQAEEIIQQNYDLAMSIGSGCTQILRELTMKKHREMPIVFTAVAKPVELGIIQSLASSGNNITGVEHTHNMKKQLTALLAVMPHIKNVLFVYDPVSQAGEHEKQVAEGKKFLEQHGVQTTTVTVFHTNELQSKVQPMLQGQDVLLILTDHTTVSGVDVLITLCNRYGVTLCASDPDSGDKGAALSYGIIQRAYGVEAAHLSLRILENHEKPTDIPIVIFEKEEKIKVNTKTMKTQHLDLSHEQLEKIKRSGGIII